MALILAGKAVAEPLRQALKSEVAEDIETLGRAPCLATVQVGEDESSAIYASRIARTLMNLGMECRPHQLDAGISKEKFQHFLVELGKMEEIDGILPLLPLPEPLGQDDLAAALNPAKDVDGIHPQNAGRLFLGHDTFVPNTPAGGMELLHHYEIPLKGKRAVVAGRSNIVGKPMALLLLSEHATVTLCHSRTENLPDLCREADILVAAIGRAKMIQGDWIKPGATVLDFGINSTDDGITGDVDFESAEAVAGAITPVPGGTGPVTNLMLARNTIKAARNNTG